jgi:hypothetical protein
MFATDWMTAENGPTIIRQPGYIQFLQQDAKCSWLPWEGPYIIPLVLIVLFMLLVAFDMDTVHSRSGSSDEYMHPAWRLSLLMPPPSNDPVDIDPNEFHIHCQQRDRARE